MKKLKLFALLVLVVLGSVLFSACTKQEVKAESIELSETNLTLRLGETVYVDVNISPTETTNKKFEIYGSYQNVVSVEADNNNMKIKITAKTEATGDMHAIIGVRSADGNFKEDNVFNNIFVEVVDDAENLSVPQNFYFNGQYLTWDAVDGAKSYTLNINGQDKITESTQFELDLEEYEGKEVVAKIKANGKSKNLDSIYSNALNFEIFNKPTNLKLNVEYNDILNTEVKTLTWNAVVGAESYSVLINGRVSNCEQNSLDITNDLDMPMNYVIKVKVNTNAQNTKFNSAYSEEISFDRLDTPSNVTIINGMLRWNTVAGATAYKVYYTYSQNGILKENEIEIKGTSYALPFDIDVGTYIAKVSSVGDKESTISSDFGFEISYSKLDSVKNIRVEDGIVLWNSVEYATSYIVYLNNILDESGNISTEVLSQTPGASNLSFELLSQSHFSAGDYEINVQAIGTDDKIAGNLLVNPFLVSKLETPTNLQVTSNNKSIIQWNRVKNASGYEVIIENSNSYSYKVNQSSNDVITFEIPNIVEVGSNLIKVKALGNKINNIEYINSSTTSQIVTEKLEAPILNTSNLKNGILSWNKIAGTSSYSVLIKQPGINDIQYNLTTTTINFNSLEYHLNAGSYQVQVKANAAENQNLLDSENCEVITISKLATKSITVQNGTVENLEADESANYQYKYKINDSSLTRTTIKDYVDSIIHSNETVYIQVFAEPINAEVEDIYYVSSDLSTKTYVYKLPTINDIKMSDGYLYFGNIYETLSDYEFKLYVDASTDNQEIIEINTNRNYNFNSINAGNHSVKLQAFSTQNDDDTVHNENNPYNLNSYVSNAYSFKKLAVPENFKISSFADKSEILGGAIATVNAYNIKMSGALVWDKVVDKTNYELIFKSDNISLITNQEYHSLQNTSILAGGTKVVKIRALGNGSNIISSDISEESLSFTKLYSPNSLSIEVNENGEKVAVWTYANGQDPNKDLSLFNLGSDTLSAAIHVFVSQNGNNVNYYSAMGSGDIITALKSNKCVIPENLSGNATLKVIAIPFNSYISSINMSELFSSSIATVNSSALKVVSDYSPEINLERLKAPSIIKLEDNILSWSALRYNDNAKAENALSEYRITISSSKDENGDKKEYIFSVSESQTQYPTVIVDNLIEPSNCVWEFSKANFENLFGNGSYVPDVYSISIQAISNYSYYTEENKITYYIDSTISSSVDVEVLNSPGIGLIDGVLAWSAISNVSKYGVSIIMPNGSKKFIELDNKTTTLTLQSTEIETYPAGEYKIDIISIGDGKKTITSEGRSESNYSQFIKLPIVEGLKVENGIIKYSSHVINSLAQDNCEFTMFIRYSNGNLEYREYSNNKYLSFELSNENDFPGARQYFISVRATGDNNTYINSDLCEEVNAFKFAIPTNLKIIDGKLTWDRASGITKYLITVSGGEYNLDATENSNSYDFDGIPSGSYEVYVKAIGDSEYLNSSAARYNNILEKLSNIEEFKIIDGYLTWKYVSNSNYRIVIDNEREIVINDSDAEVNTISDVKYVQYRLSDINLGEGEHSVYVYNYGGNTKISSLATKTIKIKKLTPPTNLLVDKETFMFKGVEGATNYAIKTKVALSEDVTKEFIYLPTDDESYDNVSGYLAIYFPTLLQKISNSIGVQLAGRKDYYLELSVIAIGNSPDELSENILYYLASNDSESLKIEQPDAPSLSFVTDGGNGINIDDGTFYGKIVWTEVEDADYYKVFIKASKEDHRVLFGYEYLSYDESELGYRTDEIASHNGYVYYIVQGKTYANVIYNDEDDTYSFIIVACKNKDGFDSADSNELLNLKYNLFNSTQDGLTSETAYQIANEKDFSYIKYNLEAKYKVTSNIEFKNTPEPIGTKEIPFNGEFDGGNFALSGENSEALNIGSKNNTFDGLFAVIGENGKVQNFTFKANISSIKITNDVLQVAFISRENYGIIDNVTTLGAIETEYNSDTYAIYAAGIAIYNYGTINYCLSNASINPKNSFKDVYSAGIAVFNYKTVSRSGFKGNATGQFAAGIVAQNFAEISECYFEDYNDNTISTYILSQNRGVAANYAGGIVALMQGNNAVINYCYSNAQVSGTTISSQIAYVGGLVGYLNSGTIKNSYVIGYRVENGETKELIFATGTQLNTIKVGVVVGVSDVRNEKGENVFYVKLSTQKVTGSGTLLYVEQSSESSLKNDIMYINNYSNYFIINNNTVYPKLKNANPNKE